MAKKTQERRKQIVDLIRTQKSIRIDDLANKLGVSAETIRTDAEELVAAGLIQRTRGALQARQAAPEIPLDMRQDENYVLKYKLMQRAVQEVKDGMTIYLDPGSTIMAGLELLKSKKDLTLVCSSAKTAMEAVKMKFSVILLGGRLDETGWRTSGYFAEEMAAHLAIDLAIFSTCGVLPNQGFSIFWDEEIGVRRKILQNCQKAIMVMDQEKMDIRAKYVFAGFDEIGLLVIDQMSPKQRGILQNVPKIALLEP